MRSLTFKNRLFVVLMFFASPAVAMEIAGVRLVDQVPLGAENLTLNGAGVWSKFFLKIYVGALYLPKRSQSVSQILEMPGPKRGTLHFLHDVSQKKLIDAWNEGFENNQSVPMLTTLRPRIEQFNQLFQAVHRGDVITLDYVPEEGTHVLINGVEKGKVPGTDFNRALLQIWLGDSPADKDLKQGLLGH